MKSNSLSNNFSQLTDLNDRMTSLYQNVTPTAPNHSLEHTIQRHSEILKDYSLDFKKIRSNIQARRDREELLGSVRKDIELVTLFIITAYFIRLILSNLQCLQGFIRVKSTYRIVFQRTRTYSEVSSIFYFNILIYFKQKYSPINFLRKIKINSSDRLVDEQIRIAMKTKEDLLIQRSTLKAIQTKMTTLASILKSFNLSLILGVWERFWFWCKILSI